ncbi:interaptin-like [Macrobrachium nipponense]|uniref:interaptin-like n=1 Tax=Macrobrachium nipponense TaxID=159736 RepID=UPI0030C803F2
MVSLSGLAVGGLVARELEELVSCYHLYTGPKAEFVLKDFPIIKDFVGNEGAVSSLVKTGGRWLSCNTVIGAGLFATSLGLFAWRKYKHHRETRQEREGSQTLRKEMERDVEESSGHDEEVTPRTESPNSAVIERDLQIQNLLAKDEEMKEEIKNLERKLAEALRNEADKDRLFKENKAETTKLRNQFDAQMKDRDNQITDLLAAAQEMREENEHLEGKLAEMKNQFAEQIDHRDHQIQSLLAEAEKRKNENQLLEERVGEALRNNEDLERRLKDENTALRNYCDIQRKENEVLEEKLRKAEANLDCMEKALQEEKAAKRSMEIMLRKDIWEGDQQLDMWMQKYEEFAEEFISLGERLEEATKERQEMERSLKSAQNYISKLNAFVKEKVEMLLKARADCQEALQVKDEELERLRQHSNDLREKLQEKEKELDHLMIPGEQLEKEEESDSGTSLGELNNSYIPEEVEEQLEKEESDSETWSSYSETLPRDWETWSSDCETWSSYSEPRPTIEVEEVGTELAQERRAKEDAEEMIRMLIKKLEDLRDAKLSTFEDKHHIEGHIRKLRMMVGDERRKEMEQIWKCCLPNTEGNIKQKEEQQDEPLVYARLPPYSLPFMDSAIPPRLKVKEPGRKFESLNKQQEEILEREIEHFMGTNDPYELLNCSPNATKEEVWLAYQSFMKNWIGKYGSFDFYSKRGFQDVKKVLLMMTTHYLNLVSSDEDLEVMQVLMGDQSMTVPQAWGAMKNVKSQMREILEMGEETVLNKNTQMMNSIVNEQIDQLLVRKNNPTMGKSLAQWMWAAKGPKTQEEEHDI